MQKCRHYTVPIIPELKPVAIKEHQSMLSKMFGTTLPSELSKAISKCKNNKNVWQLGVEWSIAQAKELLAKGAPIIHLYTMSRAKNIVAIAKGIN